MSNNTDNSGTARAARLRRIAASQGPTPAVRPNLGSQALDAQLGRMICCNTCSPHVTWAAQPISITNSAVYAIVDSDVSYIPVFGPPPGPATTTYASRNGNVWSVTFVSSTPIPPEFTITAGFVFDCNPKLTIDTILSFVVPS